MIARAEYRRLCSLIGGKHPKGDCQLVSLMISRAINGEIVDGTVCFENRNPIWHFWVRDADGQLLRQETIALHSTARR